jgi:hypothetical protein
MTLRTEEWVKTGSQQNPVTTYVYVEDQRPEFVSCVFTHVELVS